jgi:hypothetical protein
MTRLLLFIGDLFSVLGWPEGRWQWLRTEISEWFYRRAWNAGAAAKTQ